MRIQAQAVRRFQSQRLGLGIHIVFADRKVFEHIPALRIGRNSEGRTISNGIEGHAGTGNNCARRIGNGAFDSYTIFNEHMIGKSK
jgi:hypothetical protein